MQTPSREEVQLGYQAITREGPGAEITFNLGLLLVRNPHLKDVLDRMTASVVGLDAACANREPLLRGAIGGALIYGLHLGLQIGERRGPDSH